MIEPFIDTVIVCTITALTIVLAAPQSWLDARGAVAATGSMDTDGVVLTSDAFGTVVTWFPQVLAIAVLLFAVSSVITWAYYGEKAWTTLFGHGKTKRAIFRTVYLVFIVIGSLVTMSEVLALGDAMLFVCALVNILGLYLLFPVVIKELRDYRAKRKSGHFDQPHGSSPVPGDTPTLPTS